MEKSIFISHKSDQPPVGVMPSFTRQFLENALRDNPDADRFAFEVNSRTATDEDVARGFIREGTIHDWQLKPKTYMVVSAD